MLNSPNRKQLQNVVDTLNQRPPRVVGNRSGEATTLGNIAYVKHALVHFDESRFHMESVLKTIESLRAKFVSQELRAPYFATVQGYYEFYVGMPMEMCEKAPANGHDAMALPDSESPCQLVLIESLTEARV